MSSATSTSPMELSSGALLTPEVQYAFDVIPDGVVVIGPDWRFQFANRKALQLVSKDEVVGHDIFELFPGNLQDPFQTAYRTTMEQRVPSEFEAFHPEPLNLWVRVESRPFGDGIIVFFADVTTRKQAEIREQRSADRLKQVLEVTSDAVAALDREWRYTYLNANAERLIDPERLLIGRNIWEQSPSAVGSPAWDLYHRAMYDRVAGHTEFYYPAPVDAWLTLQAEPANDGIVVFFRDITEQKKHDAIVREQNELLANVQKASKLATWELDLTARTLTWGPGSFDVFGHPLDSLTTFDQLATIVVPGHSDIGAQLQEAARTGTMFVTEFAVTAADGAVLWIEARGQAVRAENGRPRLRGMAIDITDRKVDEQRLIASETRYRVLADLNPQAIWMGDPDGNITYANQGFLAYIGLTLERLPGLGWLDAFHPDDRARVVEVWSRSVTTGIDYNLEARICNAATGDYRWWNLRAAPVRDASGSILHWLGVGNDIDDAKIYADTLRAEQAETERRRAELETIYKTTPVGLALLDPVEFRFLNLNDHEAEMLGYPKEQILGRPLSEIAPIPAVLELFRHVAAGNAVRDRLLEGELASRPGERRAWSVNYSPIFNEDGSVRAISTASIEITNQKKAEVALVRSEKLAAVGRLASSISHEINNPLEAVTNLLYLISLNNGLPSELKSYVHMAQAELSRVSQIATQTLLFHRQSVAPTSVTPQDLVGAVIRLYTGRLANSHIKVEERYRTETRILCFENDIRQVLNNLIANAIDAMRKGGRLLVASHESHDPITGVPGIRITVADTGYGMNRATLARLFEPFFTTKDLNGTGLGLWISHGIVERHQGRLSVRSVEGRGTVFSLFLPCEEVSTV